MRLPNHLISLALAGLACTGGARAHAAPEVYSGMCNASAAVAVGRDRFVVADDETNTLQVYGFGRPVGAPVPLDAFLGTQPGKESDIEGAARLGDRIYWITSHGTNKSGEVQTRRYRFFATTTGDNGPITPLGRTPGDRFIQDLTSSALSAFSLKAASTIPPKQPGGLNIEGLAAWGSDKLLVGFRNPIKAGKALILPLENPADVAAGRAARFGVPIELALGGRGVRSIEWVGEGYLIAAGPIDDGDDFALYRWSGPGTTEVVELDRSGLGDLHVEAMFVTGGDVYVLSDDGKRGGVDCKDRAEKTFRGQRLTPVDLRPARRQ